jgi:hypothetical protein
MFTSGRPGDPEDKLDGTDGRPVPGAVVRLVDEAGRPVGAGVEGEVEAYGPQLTVLNGIDMVPFIKPSGKTGKYGKPRYEGAWYGATFDDTAYIYEKMAKDQDALATNARERMEEVTVALDYLRAHPTENAPHWILYYQSNRLLARRDRGAHVTRRPPVEKSSWSRAPPSAMSNPLPRWHCSAHGLECRGWSRRGVSTPLTTKGSWVPKRSSPSVGET